MSKLILHRLDKQERERYGILDMSAIEDERLSDASLGLLLYLVSRPTGWNTSVEGIASRRKSGKTAIKTCLKELQDCGYLKIERVKGNGSKPVETTWTVYEASQKAAAPPKAKTSSVTYQAGNELNTESPVTQGEQANTSNVVYISAYQPENPDDTKTSSVTYQAGNELDAFYQAGNELDANPGNMAKTKSGKGPSYQAGNQPVLKKNIEEKKEHSSAPDKPVRGKKSSSLKSPAQKPGEEFPREVYALMNYLEAAKKAQGVTDIAFDGRWRGQSKKAGKEMLDSGLSLDYLKAVIDYLLESPFHGPHTLSLYDVKRKLHVYQAQSSASSGKTATQANGTHGVVYTNDMDEIDRFLAEQRAMFEGNI